MHWWVQFSVVSAARIFSFTVLFISFEFLLLYCEYILFCFFYLLKYDQFYFGAFVLVRQDHMLTTTSTPQVKLLYDQSVSMCIHAISSFSNILIGLMSQSPLVFHIRRFDCEEKKYSFFRLSVFFHYFIVYFVVFIIFVL
jgi:hypothetical protein